MKKIMVIFGTRPEAIKLAPVILKLRKTGFKTEVIHTGQHSDLADPVLKLFGIEADHNLQVMQPEQDLNDLTAHLMSALGNVISSSEPDIVMVQGDTSTAFCGALSAYYQQIPVAHVEAGLRSNRRYNPFPEELNRSMISRIAEFHFAPTHLNRENLLGEGISVENIFVTGNTVIDALHHIHDTNSFESERPGILDQINKGQQIALLTTHRRENHGEPMVQIFKAAGRILNNHEKLDIIFPMHPNPVIRRAMDEAGLIHSRFHPVPAMEYLSFQHLMKAADLILTDSGGIQEEAVALNKKLIVLREETERQELVDAGLGRLTGTDPGRIAETASELLESEHTGGIHMQLYGDGTAASQIADILCDWFEAEE